MRALAFSVAVTACFSTSAPARAETLYGQAGNCVGGVADVRRWRPELGAPAAFVADAYTSSEGTLFVGLGFDEAGYWSAEDHTGSDASDGPGTLFLAHTRFDGGRRLFRVYDGTGHASFDELARPDDTPEQSLSRFRAAQRAAIEQRLFTLAAGPWKVATLSHRYRWKTPGETAEGALAFTGWFVEAAEPGKAPLRFGIFGEPFMCWCDYGWRGYALAAPARKKR